MSTAQSVADLLFEVVNGGRRGDKLALLNLSEQSFRSSFNQYTDLHRRLFVALVLDQIVLACPDPCFILYSGRPSKDSGSATDEVFQSYADIWLHEHGNRCFCSASAATVTEKEIPDLLGALSLAITADESLIRALVSTICPFIALMGSTKSYSRIDALRSLLTASPRHLGRAVSEIHAISSEVPSAMSRGVCEDGLSTSASLGSLFGTRRREKPVRYLLFLRGPSRGIVCPDAREAVQLNPLNLGVAEPLVFDIHDPELEQSLLNVTQAHFQRLAAHPDRLGSDLASITFDGDLSFAPDMLEPDAPHDEDYIVFRGFADPESLILDLGAIWGYSVASIAASGAKSRIASFEAIPMYCTCLAVVAELRPKKYHYFMTALSDSPGEPVFTVLDVNHQALSALTTAADHPNFHSIVTNVVNHIRQWMNYLQAFQYGLVSFLVPVQRLDDVVIFHAEPFADREVVAIKIDVEGMEYPVLPGAANLISMHKPLIMEEVGISNQSHNQHLQGLGSQLAERSGSSLSPDTPGTASGINGFFVHRDKLDQYQVQGILA